MEFTMLINEFITKLGITNYTVFFLIMSLFFIFFELLISKFLKEDYTNNAGHKWGFLVFVLMNILNIIFSSILAMLLYTIWLPILIVVLVLGFKLVLYVLLVYRRG